MQLTIPSPQDRSYSDLALHDSGGQSVVFSATYVPTGERIAVKVLKPVHGAAKQRREEQFLQEVRLLRRISHPNIVRVFEVLEEVRLDGEPTKAFVMEWMVSHLGKAMLRRPKGIEIGELAGHLGEALAGLGVLHRHRVAVRDLRPANLLINADGELKLADLGMARTEEIAVSMVESSRYVAPEVLDGTIRGSRREDPPPGRRLLW